jgi:Tfp pilus assembly protein PilN
MPKNKPINLLPQEEFNASTTGRVLKWATGTFRIIVIITEMVVMAAFLSRFWLDAQNSALNNSIKIKIAQISAQADFEQQFRGIQSKLNIFDKLASGQKYSELIDKVTSLVPGPITLASLSVENGTLNIRGSSQSNYAITQFVTALQQDPFKSAELQQVGISDTDSASIVFTIEVKY